MNNQTIVINKSSKVPLDLRAPVFTRIRKGSWWLRLITLLLLDYALLYTCWTLAQNYAYSVIFPWYDLSEFLSLSITILIQISALAVQGIYQAGKRRHDYLNIIKGITFAHGLILLFCFFYQPIVLVTRSTFISSWLLSISFICAGRFAVDVIVEYLRQQKMLCKASVFVIGEPEENEQILNLIQQEKCYIISGTASSQSLDKENRQETLEHLHRLGVTEAFVSWSAIQHRMFLCWLFQSSGITIHIIPTQLKPIYRDGKFNKIGGRYFLSFDCPIITGKDFWIKRSMDLCFTVLFLIFSFPIYIAIAIAIKLDSPGPIFFKQTRIGLHGKPFKVWKFRTMRADAEKLQKELEALNETKDGILFKIKDDPRVTRVGKFLRRYSLDELAQLFNVLCGEMSLVGPRPLPTRDVDKFSEHHFIRHEVLPGITGLWQVSGRSDILDFEQVSNLDMNYIENWSLRLDLAILFKTVMVILNKTGAY